MSYNTKSQKYNSKLHQTDQSDRRPPILQGPHSSVSLGDAGLDGEDHAGLDQPRVVVEAVVDVRGAVEEVADAVTQEAGHHRAAVTPGVLVDGLTQSSSQNITDFLPTLLLVTCENSPWLAIVYS